MYVCVVCVCVCACDVLHMYVYMYVFGDNTKACNVSSEHFCQLHVAWCYQSDNDNNGALI